MFFKPLLRVKRKISKEMEMGEKAYKTSPLFTVITQLRKIAIS